MARLIYSAIASADSYVEDFAGRPSCRDLLGGSVS
jgi:hypothetical protein